MTKAQGKEGVDAAVALAKQLGIWPMYPHLLAIKEFTIRYDAMGFATVDVVYEEMEYGSISAVQRKFKFIEEV